MSFAELIQLLEAVAVDDLLQTAVVVVVDVRRSTAKLHQLAVLLGVRMPLRDSLTVGIPVVRKLCPHVAQ